MYKKILIIAITYLLLYLIKFKIKFKIFVLNRKKLTLFNIFYCKNKIFYLLKFYQKNKIYLIFFIKYITLQDDLIAKILNHTVTSSIQVKV